jgi:diguanylate cyclase (GGDEF)-like protein/PAS domain S-box-containing protein
MKRRTENTGSSVSGRGVHLFPVIRRCLPWVGVLIFTGALFLSLRQLALVVLIFMPVLWLYGRECLHRRMGRSQQHRSEIRLKCVLGTVSEGVLILDAEGYMVVVNRSAEKILEYEKDELIHQSLDMIVPNTVGHAEVNAVGVLVEKCLVDGVPVHVEELPLLIRSGRTVPAFFSMAPIAGERGIDGAVITFHGLSEKKALQTRLRMMDTLDPVTGVNNRWAVERQLSVEIERARRHQRPLSILMVDIDHFKRINNTYGQRNGDTVLRAAGDTMAGMMRASDIVGRFNSETFIAVLPETALENALILAERLRETIAALAVSLNDDRSVYFTISVGTAAFPESGKSVDALIHAADLALYRAKNNGRDCVVSGHAPPVSTGP